MANSGRADENAGTAHRPTQQAIAVLEQLKPITGEREYLFPNEHKPRGMMSENTILFALYRMGYRGRATGHGFRATASTILNEQGFKADVIERQLAHKEPNKVRAAYDHSEHLPERRKMMQHWADYLDARKRAADIHPFSWRKTSVCDNYFTAIEEVPDLHGAYHNHQRL